jgi:hypothetical protein
VFVMLLSRRVCSRFDLRPLSTKLVFAGASAVYPLDMAKTQLQMDKAGKFSGLFDCFGKIARGEGIGALYRGLPANIIGIMPEKTIKLAGNDFFRQQFQVTSLIRVRNQVGV